MQVDTARKRDFGEVYTPEWVVREMCDMLGDRWLGGTVLEPACGNGNFLEEILRRKLKYVSRTFFEERELYSAIVVSTIYGVDILEDNVIAARERLLGVYKEFCSDYVDSVRYILERNIIWGNTLDMRFHNGGDMYFTEWGFDRAGVSRRKDTYLKDMVKMHENGKQGDLFLSGDYEGDRGCYDAKPFREFEPTDIRDMMNIEEG